MKKILMTIVFICMIVLVGCEDEEMINENEELKGEVKDLKDQITTLEGQVTSLQEENTRLKETADYHYRQGIDFFNAGNWNNARTEFETVINKYPESDLVSKAKSKLKETIDKLAESVFNTAVDLMDKEQWTQAKAKLEMLVEKYPESSYVGKAKSKLKETIDKLAESVFNAAVDLMEKEQWTAAKTKLEMLIESYPDSSYVGKAKSKLRTIETELMYVVSTIDGAIKEWKLLRSNEREHIGDVVTWKMRVGVVTSKLPHCYLPVPGAHPELSTDYPIEVVGIEGFTYLEAVNLGMLPVVHADDWLVVTGEFIGIHEDGYILLRPIRVKNIGYQ